MTNVARTAWACSIYSCEPAYTESVTSPGTRPWLLFGRGLIAAANAQQDTLRRSPKVDSAHAEVVPLTRTLGDAEAAGLKLIGVFDAGDGHWISGATVRDTLGGETTTSSIGVAALNNLTPLVGYYILEIRKPGYAPRRLRLRADTTAEVLASLEPNPLGSGTTLAAVVVTARRRLVEDAGKREGFITRCESGLIACVGRSELDRHPTGGPGALLNHVEGIHLECRNSRNGCAVQMHPIAGKAYCTPQFFLNGLPWDPGTGQAQLDKFLNSSNIDGVEVYVPTAPHPARFNPASHFDPTGSCGSIVIWTR